LPFYVKLVGGHNNQNQVLRPNGYPDYQWFHCVKGSGKLLIDGKEFIISKNTGFYLSPNFPHEYYSIEEPWETHWVAFSGYGVHQLFESLNFNHYGVFHFNDLKFIDTIITDIFYGAKTDTPSTRLKNSSKLYNLLIEVKNLTRENSNNQENIYYEKLKPVLSFIENNYNKNPSIEDMAWIIKVTPQYLCRLFKKNMNMRPFTYLTQYRLQKAKEMLLNNMEMKIGTIYTEVGYNDESYFCALFKKNEGLTPSEFRNLNRL